MPHTIENGHSQTTVVIKTIGRDTLRDAVNSARREGFEPLIISDGVNVPEHDQGEKRTIVKLGKEWGFYGGMAANVGAALVPTEFITFLDDDDVFIEGAGDIIRSKLKESPEVDIWIAGVRFQLDVSLMDNGKVVYKGRELSLNSDRGVTPGNVSMPTYRASIFSKSPFINNVDEHHLHLSDFLHVLQCHRLEYKIDWFGSVLYDVRPHDGKANGQGKT